MGSFSNPFGAVRIGFDNQCRIKRVQGVRACVVVRGTISLCQAVSDRTIPTDITCIHRTCHISEGLCNMSRVPTMAKGNIVCYAHLLNRFRVKVSSNPRWPFLAKKDTERSHSCTAFPVEFLSPKKCPPSTHYEDCGHLKNINKVDPIPVTAVQSFGIFQK